MVEMVTVMAVTRLCFFGAEAINFPENIIKYKPKFTEKEPINIVEFSLNDFHFPCYIAPSIL